MISPPWLYRKSTIDIWHEIIYHKCVIEDTEKEIERRMKTDEPIRDYVGNVFYRSMYIDYLREELHKRGWSWK